MKHIARILALTARLLFSLPQPLFVFGATSPSKDEKVRIPFPGISLRVEDQDLRENFLPPHLVAQHILDGTVCLVKFRANSIEIIQERSTNEWKTVKNVVDELVQRTWRDPQIRIVQKNAILQSELGPPGRSSREFLETQVRAGDIVYVCGRQ